MGFSDDGFKKDSVDENIYIKLGMFVGFSVRKIYHIQNRFYYLSEEGVHENFLTFLTFLIKIDRTGLITD